MLFNSLVFAIFLPIVFLIYWFVVNKDLKLQNLFIIAASYLFYGWWDWRFLLLMAASSVIDFLIALLIHGASSNRGRKFYLGISLCFNLGLLGFFKYFNFFVDSFITAFPLFSNEHGFSTLNIILPIGISFYTFQSLSYTIDVYKRELEPTKNIFSFLAFVSFFPQLVAGPIERAKELLPQFYKNRVFSYELSIDGLREILWGLFMKMVIADNCAKGANEIFNNYEKFPGGTLVLGAIFFAFQIYGDFGGYSLIARGTAKLFGFNLMRNFDYPYFSKSIGEFWRKWHISLSSWFRDYVYYPMGGSRVEGKWKLWFNVFVVFFLSGFWHGANWTFICWGVLNALFYIPSIVFKKSGRVDSNRGFVKDLISMLSTFTIICLAWIFFRAVNMGHALGYLSKIFSLSLFQVYLSINHFQILLLILFFVVIEWFSKNKNHVLENLRFKPVYRWLLYLGLTLIIIVNAENQDTFIYFQF